MEQQIIELLTKLNNNEIKYSDCYLQLQKFPTDVRDKVITLYLLNKKNSEENQHETTKC